MFHSDFYMNDQYKYLRGIDCETWLKLTAISKKHVKKPLKTQQYDDFDTMCIKQIKISP